MDDEQEQETEAQKEAGLGGVDLRAGTRRLQVDRETTARLLDHVGPYLRWIVLAIAFSITTISIFYGISLIWT